MPDPNTPGLTTAPPATEVDPAIQALQAKAAEFQKAGIDLSKLDPDTVSKSFATVQRYAKFDLRGEVEKRATQLEAQRAKKAEEDSRRTAKSSRRDDDEEEEVDLEELKDLPPAALKLLGKMAQRLETLEGGIETAGKADQEASIKNELKAVWANDYAEVIRQYPIIAEKPEVDRAMRVILTAHLATTDDDDAHKPGYVQRVAPLALQVLAAGGRELAALLDDKSGDLRPGGPRPAQKLDFEKMTDDEYEQSLASALYGS